MKKKKNDFTDFKLKRRSNILREIKERVERHQKDGEISILSSSSEKDKGDF